MSLRRQASMSDDTKQGMARSSSGVWWKLGDGDPEVERRLRVIAQEEAAVKARMERRHAAAPAVRRSVAVTSVGLELLALLWAATSWRRRRRRRTRLLLPAIAVPALATVVLAALPRLRKAFDARDQHHLLRLAAERKARLGYFRGSHHNLQKLIQKYDPDAATSDHEAAAASKKLKRTHSRLSFHVGDE